MVSGWLQTIYYGITIRAGDPKPQPGSPRYQLHRRRIQIAVILIYLLYTVYETDYWIRQSGDFYQDLGLSLDSDERKIKSRFRRLAALHHPDKINSDDPAAMLEADNYYVLLKSAQDTLSDPVKKFAYTRFGPDVLTWQHCKTIRDYLMHGMQVSVAPLYAGSAFVMIILGFTGYLQQGKFWRWVIFGALAILEMHMITRPYTSPILAKVVNPLLEWTTLGRHPQMLPFQLVQLARKATFTLFIAVSQIGGLMAQQKPTASGAAMGQHEMAQLARLETIAQNTDAEAARLLALDTAPFVGDEVATKELQGKIREWLVTNTVRADPEVRDAVGRAMTRRREGAPARARQQIRA